MIRIDTGEQIELHIHNVRFNDPTNEIVVDAGIETYWMGADRVSYIGFTKWDLRRLRNSQKNSIPYLISLRQPLIPIQNGRLDER